jgi:hypothetical protein
MAEVNMERLLPALEVTYSFARDDRYLKMVRANLGVCGNELLSHINDEDRVGFLAPVSFHENGKDLDGCILTLDDRAVFAWWTGLLRVKNSEEVIRYDEITGVEKHTKPAGVMTAAVPTMVVHATRTWAVTFPNVYGEKPAVPMLVAGVLDGSVTPKYSEDASAD